MKNSRLNQRRERVSGGRVGAPRLMLEKLTINVDAASDQKLALSS